MTSKVVFKILIGIVLYFSLSLSYKAFHNNFISDTCLTNSFNTHFSDLSTIKMNATYDFDELFDCQKWDEILITDAYYYMRGFGYLSNGVLVPSYDPFQYPEGTYLVYFLKDNIILCNSVSLYDDNFIFSQHFRNFNYIKMKRKNAKFIYTKFEHSDFDLNTLEVIQ